MNTLQMMQRSKHKYSVIRHLLLTAIRRSPLWLAFCAMLFSALPAAGATPDVSSTKGKSFDLGEPIASNTGGFYWEKSVLNLGGLLPLTVEFYSYMNDPGSHRFSTNLHNIVDFWEWRPFTNDCATVEFGRQAQRPQMSKSLTTGQWGLFQYNDPGRNFTMQDTAGYYYLLDPVDEEVWIFEKNADPDNPDGRLKWRMDRHGNRLTYHYATADADFPMQVYENDGSPGNRVLILERVADGGNVAFGAAEALWNGAAWETGRSILLVYSGMVDSAPAYWKPLIVRDAMGQDTLFDWELTEQTYPWDPVADYIQSMTYPAGNTPFTQAAIVDSYWDGTDHVLVTSQTDAYGNTTEVGYPGIGVVETRPDGNSVTYASEKKFGPPASLTDAGGKQAGFTSDYNDRITSITDRMGGVTSMTYHAASGKLASLTNAAGHTITYTYTNQDQVITNPANSETVTVTFYNLTRIDYPDGTNEQFAYDGQGNVTSRIDRSGQTWTFTYNAKGQSLTQTNPTGGVTTYTYNADSTLATSTDTESGLTTYAYDQYKRLTSVTHPGGTMEMTYNLNDQLTSVTDERDHVTTFAYDANGNLTTITQPGGATVEYAYDLLDRLASLTNQAGKTTHYAYDTLNRLATITDPNTHQTQFGYDPRGWQNALTDAAGQVWPTGYDDEGLPTSHQTPSGRQTTFGYNTLGHLTSTTNPLGQTTTLTRDAMTRVTASTDALNRTTTYAYSGNDRLTAVTLPDGTSAGYVYNALGQLSQITDPNGQPWDLAYTQIGRLQALTDPLSRTWQYAYDARGLLATVTYPDSGTQSLVYDSAGNLTQTQYSGGPTHFFTYDELNRLTGSNDIIVNHDAVSRITVTQDSDGTVFGATYDDGGRLSTVTYNSGTFTVTYTYDSRDRLTRVSDPLSGAWIDFTYDNDDQLTGLTRSNGVNAVYDYDAAGRLTRMRDGAFQDQQLTYNAAGDITGMTLTAPLEPGAALSVATQTFTHDAAAQISSAGYAYDARGRLTTAPERAYGWNDASHLTQLVEGGVTTTLTYNGLGDLRTRSRSGEQRQYYYNYAVGLHPIMAERDAGSGQMLRYFVYAPGGQLLYLIEHAAGNAAYFYHFDQIGSTLALTDAAGVVTDAYAYDPYGRLVNRTGTHSQPFTFIGQYGVRQEDAGGTLYHIRARYYDAQTSRFISKDPVWPQIDDPHQLNPYQYAANQPLRYIDPSGLFFNNGLTFDELGNNLPILFFMEHWHKAGFDPGDINEELLFKIVEMKQSFRAAIYGSVTEQLIGKREIVRKPPVGPGSQEDAGTASRKRFPTMTPGLEFVREPSEMEKAKTEREWMAASEEGKQLLELYMPYHIASFQAAFAVPFSYLIMNEINQQRSRQNPYLK